MAAITPIQVTGEYQTVRSATAQASTGQTDWLAVPAWAKSAVVCFNVTGSGGTTPGPTTFSILAASPVSKDDTDSVTIFTGAAITTLTTVHFYEIGAGTGVGTAVADAAGADAYVTTTGQLTVLPTLLGLKVLNDRTNGDETYTYDLSIQFRR